LSYSTWSDTPLELIFREGVEIILYERENLGGFWDFFKWGG